MLAQAVEPNYTITREQALRKSYIRALRDEIFGGVLSSEDALSSLRINQPSILTYKKRIIGQGGPVKEYADWADFLVTDFGPRKRCLSLGSGIGRMEKYLVNAGFTERMETIELCADANESIRLKDSRIDTQPGDLNFLELRPNSYDFLLCHAVLHHLINLEHVLHMINLALKEDGLFLAYEYVGETRWQFTERRLDYLKNMFGGLEFRRPMPWSVGGFESVRSGEVLGLIQAQFGNKCKRAVCYGGVYFPFLICTAPGADVHIDRVIELDERVAKKGILPPCYLMGIYGKSERPAIPARPWSDDELDSRLMPPTPLRIRARHALRISPVGPLLRWAKRALTGMPGGRP